PALDSQRYHEEEIAKLLDRNLPFWEKGDFTLSLRHFTLLNVLIGEERSKQNELVQSLMLRGTLEFDQYVDKWWAACPDTARQRACFHALKVGEKTIWPRTLKLMTPTDWAKRTDPETIASVSALLLPISTSTPVALEFLEAALPESKTW